ncbi:MAG: endo alpha-1,4 polygalactosaminidase, partial [Gemmatimonadales bacterium]
MLVAQVACGDGGGQVPLATEDPALPPVTSGSWYRPSVTTTWQWQLVGAINTAYGVDLYDIDLFNVPDNVVDGLRAAGRRVVCYFSAGTDEPLRPDA